MINTRDLYPEASGFDHVEAKHELDGAKRTGLDRLKIVIEAVDEDVAIIDRIAPEKTPIQTDPFGRQFKAPETASNVVDMQEYRQRREMRHEARQQIEEMASPASAAPEQPVVDEQAQYLQDVYSMIDRVRAEQNSQEAA